MIRATTKRLLLRDITPADAPYILAQLNDPGWLKYIGDRGIRSIEAAEEYIKDKIIKQYIEEGFGMFLVAIRKGDEEKEIVGQCGLVKREGLEHVDIGFAFLEEHCGKGYGTEAALAVKDLGLNEYKLEKIVAITTEDNVPSRKLLENIGFQYIKMIELPNIEGLSTYYELL